MKFTIIIPCYNSEKWIRKCISSALNQTYQDTEVIFVDNESKDNSLAIAKEMQAINPDLKVLTAKNIYRHSYQEPVEEGLKNATGEYFTILGSDDFLDEKYVENIVELLTKAKQITVLQSPLHCVKEENSSVIEVIKHKYNSMSEFKQRLFSGCPVTTPTLVVKKELYDTGRVSWRSDKFLGASDYDLYFSLADQNIFIYPFPKWLGYYYRWNSEQSTWGMHREETDYDKLIKEEWAEKWQA